MGERTNYTHGSAARGVAIERQRVAGFLQELLLEAPQGDRMLAAIAELVERGAVDFEELFMRVVAREQLQHEFVQIKTAQQAAAFQLRQPALPFRLVQRAQFAFAAPGQQERLECEQHAAQHRSRTARAARNQRDAAVIAGEHLDDQAGFTKWVTMQHEGGLRLVPRVARVP